MEPKVRLLVTCLDPWFYDEETQFTDLYRITMWINMFNRYLITHHVLPFVFISFWVQMTNCLKS